MKKCFYLLLLTWTLAGCSSQTKENGDNVLKATLKETEVSLKDLFSRIEVIPLETNDTALMDHVHRIRKVNNKYYILNEDYPGFQYINILVYDAEGNFLHPIGKKGQGPEEYPWLIYDMDIDAEKDLVYMMSPSGILYLYRMDGSFVRKMNMPEGLIYHGLQFLNSNQLLSWAGGTDIDNDAMSVLDADSAKLIKGLWRDHNEPNWDIRIFTHAYQDKIYFTPSIDRQVYEVTSDSLRIAYEWDFGEDNYDASSVRSRLEGLTRVDKGKEWDEMRRTGGVPYTLFKQGQTNKYYFTTVLGILGERDDKGYPPNYFSLFYEKATGRSFYFKKTTEGLAIRPNMITEEALYQLIPTEDLELLLPVLDEAEKAKIMKRLEDDNPCLVKFIP